MKGCVEVWWRGLVWAVAVQQTEVDCIGTAEPGNSEPGTAEVDIEGAGSWIGIEALDTIVGIEVDFVGDCWSAHLVSPYPY